MYLASGVCRALEIEASGAPLGLGVDGSSSNDASNLCEELRQAFFLQRLSSGKSVRYTDALRWATEGGARCLGRHDIGRLQVGFEADLALFSLDNLRHSGYHDPLAALVICGATRADHVMIAGTWRVSDGHIVGVDQADLLSRHNQSARKLRQLSGMEG